MKWLGWAPLLAALAHIVEEFVYPGGFAGWDRTYRPKIRSSITPRLQLVINAALVFMCVSVGGAGTSGGVGSLGDVHIRSMIPPQSAVAAWLALAVLLFSNAIFHILGTVQTNRTSPGVRTGLLLYIPLAVFGFWYFLSSGLASPVSQSRRHCSVGPIIFGQQCFTRCVPGVSSRADGLEDIDVEEEDNYD
jgi:hypothetical protein